MYRNVATVLLLGSVVSCSLLSAGGEGAPSFVEANGWSENRIRRSSSTTALKGLSEYHGTMALVMKQLEKRRSLSEGDAENSYSQEAAIPLIHLPRSKSVPLPKN